MDLEHAVPILVPAIIIQVCIQAYYISHCWKNDALSQKQKALYTVLIALFNLPAASAYMFFRGRKQPAGKAPDISGMHTDNGIEQGVFVLFVIAYEALAINISLNGRSGYQGLVIWLLGAAFVLALLNGLFIRPGHKLFYYAMPAAQLLLTLVINYLDFSTSSQFIVLVMVATVINSLTLKESKIYSSGAFLLYFGSNIVKLSAMGIMPDDNLFFGSMYVNSIMFILVFAAFYTMKKQLLLNGLLQKALAENDEKSLRLEEMGAVDERNRIAAEIHDNVGHKLTAAMISVEAGEKLLRSDSCEAQKKLALARQQIKDGLQSIRLSVKAIKQGEEKDFRQSLRELIEQIQKDTPLRIILVCENDIDLLPIQQNVLLRAIVECATNSIKHGKSTQADILIQQRGGTVSMTFSDNGAGAQDAAFGFGLNNMLERVRSMGGTLHTESGQGEGFTVAVSIPAGKAGNA
jgi:signal transduction histidine kinase